ncbi:MAG TPA: response regulator [Thermoanaerobaculaceae bacterium]|nr:response regulator [Thermoanaerobaculaceae bacterium]
MTGEATRPLRVAIVDDEAPARALLREYLAGVPDVELVAECANGFEAVKAVAELDPDLLLLDIRMPKLDGFEVLELLEREVAVVFVTAYDEHALRAFEVNAVDYLLKPLAKDRLLLALDRARARLREGRPFPVAEVLAAARPAGAPLARVLVREGSRVHVIPIEKLDLVEARDDYICLHSAGNEYRKQQTLAALAAQLDPVRFVRVHRSFIVNVERLAGIELYAKDSRIAILRDGTKVPLSRAGYGRLRELL